VARALVADERFETIAHAALNRADCAQRLATVLSRVEIVTLLDAPTA
jgi:hypothetical protein